MQADRNTRAARRRAQSGFTLMELVTAVFVMAVLAAVAMPSYTESTDRKLDMVQLQIQDALDHARSLAYHTGEVTGVKFGIDEVSDGSAWIAVVNALGVPHVDPLTKSFYIVRLDAPGQPSKVDIVDAAFGPADRNLAGFTDKGVLYQPGTILIQADDEQRLFSVTTSTGRLQEVPIGS